MKNAIRAIACVLVFGMMLDLFGETVIRKCTIKTMIGSVKIRKGSTVNWFDAKPNMILKERDAIRTMLESEVELETSEGTILKVGENTAVELATLMEKGDVQNTKVKIMNGSMLCNVKKLINGQSTFTFETPTATASIRGTIVSFDVTKEKTLIRVYEGSVAVTGDDKKEMVILKYNQMTSVIKGQKTILIEQLDDNKAKKIMNDSVSTDSLKSINDSLKQTGSLQSNTAGELVLSVLSPADKQLFTKTIVPVSGKTSPGAEVTVNSIRINVAEDGFFNGTIAIPNEEGDAVLDIETSLNTEKKHMTRTVSYKPEYRFSVLFPQDKQTVNSTIIQIKGEIQPVSSEVSVNGTRMNVSKNGVFTGVIQIPDEEGTVTLDFETTDGSTTHSETKNIVYKRAPDAIVPQLKGYMPDIASTAQISFTVIDRTVDEEITFFYEIDGAKTSDVGTPNSPFTVPIEAGVHKYVVYAKDKAGNMSQKMSKTISYLLSNMWTITMRKPVNVEYIDIPPSAPDFVFQPKYTVEFSIEKLPDDDMRLIRDITITNKTTGKTIQDKTFTSNYIERDFDLSPRTANVFVIEVTDVNGNKKTQKAQVILR